MMNKTLAVAFSLLLAAPLHAEERDVLFADDAVHGGFGGPMLGVTSINGNTELITGGGGAWLIDHRFFLGGRGVGISSNLENTNVGFGYGGIWTGFIFNPSKVTNFSVDVLIGGGGLSEVDNNNYMNHSDDAVAVIEPGVNLRVNLSKFAALSIGGSYRVVNGSSNAVLTNSKLSGANFLVNVMFGKF